LLSLEIVRAR